MTEKGTRRPVPDRRRAQSGAHSGLTTRRQKKSALRRALRALSGAGFTCGRKLVISKSGRAVEIAFPNYIRAERGSFRMPDEAGIADVFALIALHYAETELKG